MRGNVNAAVRTATTTHRLGRGVAASVGLVACAGIVWTSSHAAFTDSVTNNGNTIGAGTLDINNNVSTALFAPTDKTVGPGDSIVTCISITNAGTLTPKFTKIYLPTSAAQEREGAAGTYGTWVSTVTGGGTTYPIMDDSSTLRIEESDEQATDPASACTGANYADKAGATGTNLRTLINTKNAWGTGIAVSNTTPGKFRSYRYTFAIDAAADNELQGDGVQFGVTTEAQY